MIDRQTGRVLPEWQANIVARDMTKAMVLPSAIADLLYPQEIMGEARIELARQQPFFREIEAAAGAKLAELRHRYDPREPRGGASGGADHG